MRILFVTMDDSLDPNSNNNAYYIRKGMEEAGNEVMPYQLSPLTRAEKLRYVTQKLISRYQGMVYHASVEPTVTARRGAALCKQIARVRPDVVLTNSAMCLAGLERSSVPQAVYADAPVAAVSHLGQYHNTWSPRSRSLFQALDRACITRATHVIFHSRWAVQQAQKFYELDSSSLHYVLPGANLPFVPPTFATVDRPRGETIELLFWGRAWNRKGGPTALRIAENIYRMNRSVRLTICGPNKVDMKTRDLPYVEFKGLIKKPATDELDSIAKLFQASDYLLLPTLADTSSAALREAAAFGVPSVATRLGGLPELLVDGESAMFFKLDTDPATIAARIVKNFDRDHSRVQMRRAARRQYEAALNWGVAARAITNIIRCNS